MVHLTLLSPKGNQAVRYFPYQGYLGLTPLKVEGVVRTKLDDDAKYLPAKTITVSVRCYESKLGRLQTQHSNVILDYTQVLWTKQDGEEYGEVGDSEYPFRITIPARVGGHSTAHFQDYRVWWRVEACITHIPMGSVGTRQLKHFELPLVRYDIPPHPSTPSSPVSHLGSQTNKPRAPIIRYRQFVPSTPVGPQDLLSIPISLHPMDPAVSIRSASLIIERRLQIIEPSSSSSSPMPTTPSSSSHADSFSNSAPSSQSPIACFVPQTPPDDEPTLRRRTLGPYSTPSSASPSPHTSTIFLESSDQTIRPLISANINIPSYKTATQSVAGAESGGRFTRGDDGVWTKTLTLQWPASKSNARWAMGETLSTDMASVRFFVRTKIIVSSPSGTESIDLEEQEIIVVSTNDSERQVALAKWNEFREQSASSARTKSKSPRRAQRERESLPSPPQSPPSRSGPSIASGSLQLSYNLLTVPKSAGGAERSSYSHEASAARNASTASSPYGAKFKKAPRRPHTSAGPRDSSNEFRREFERKRPEEPHPFHPSNPLDMVNLAVVTPVENSSPSGGAFATIPNAFRRIRNATPALSTSTGSSSASGTSATDSSSESEAALDDDKVKAWEAELVRIESESRRSSRDMLGLFKRKLVHVERD